MALNIIVCIKQVPDPEHFDKIRLDPETKTINRAEVPSIINPLDRNAVEEALRIRERFSGRVVGISRGPPQARAALEGALAAGIDQAILLCDQAFAGADTLATAYCLACAIRRLEPYDLILCGNETADGATAQVAPQLAELLDLPHVTAAERIDFVEERRLLVRRAIENGHMKVAVTMPAVVAVAKGINQPRLPTVQGITEAATKPLHTWGASDVGAQSCYVGWEGSPSRTVQVLASPRRQGEIFEGEPEAVVEKALKRLREVEAL
ncbi:MAG TPA: electron transfer flavoprotein subunit beta/FixA family protein [Dehalococcoidia bacterium]|nr:electron transfer flavoprotein subunit beta/FixA family protein [Dehalococcoidia bacterium]